MVTTSVAYINTTYNITEILTRNFNEAMRWVTENYEKCRKIHDFCSDRKNKEFQDTDG